MPRTLLHLDTTQSVGNLMVGFVLYRTRKLADNDTGLQSFLVCTANGGGSGFALGCLLHERISQKQLLSRPVRFCSCIFRLSNRRWGPTAQLSSCHGSHEMWLAHRKNSRCLTGLTSLLVQKTNSSYSRVVKLKSRPAYAAAVSVATAFVAQRSQRFLRCNGLLRCTCWLLICTCVPFRQLGAHLACTFPSTRRPSRVYLSVNSAPISRLVVFGERASRASLIFTFFVNVSATFSSNLLHL